MLHHDAFGHLQLLLPSLVRFQNELKGAIWSTVGGPLEVSQTPATPEHLPVDASSQLHFSKVSSYPHYWGREFDQCFWKVTVPPQYADGGHYLRWDDQGEATVFVNGRPHYGFDPGHGAMPLPTGATELLVESICCRSGVWVNNEPQGISGRGSMFHGAWVLTRNDAAWKAYYDVDVLLQLAMFSFRRENPLAENPLDPGRLRQPLEQLTPAVRKIFSALVQAQQVWGASADATAGARLVTDVLAPLYAELKAHGSLGHEVVLTGHAHIDLVWLWPERVAEFKAVHSFANALSVKHRYPEVKFGYSQPASYEAVARRHPPTDVAVRQAIHDGWWEAEGVTYVESDTQLSCGESLLRSFELGQQGFEDLTGKKSKVLWLPDCFGFAPCLPQLIRGFGGEHFFTTKLFWSNATKFPYSSFRWIGADGSEVTSHVAFQFYNNGGEAKEIIQYALNNRQSDIHSQSLGCIGYGDGGGGLNDEMVERTTRLSGLSGAPDCKFGRIDAFFDSLAKIRHKLPAWQGELYLEFHQGVQTSIHDLKHTYRQAERGLQYWEAAAALTGRQSASESSWKRVVFAQFHDYLPGSSIKKVYDEAIPELHSIALKTRSAAETALGGAGTSLFNPLAVTQTAYDGQRWVTVPPLSIVNPAKAVVIPGMVRADARSLSSDRVRVQFDDGGRVTSLVVDGVASEVDRPMNELVLLTDRPSQYDAWNIDRNTLMGGKSIVASGGKVVNKDGKTGVSFDVAFGRSSGTITYLLHPGAGAVEVELEVDFQESGHLLKTTFATKYAGTNARYGAPFGSSLRRQLPGPVHGDGQFENPASRWAVVSDDTEGTGLMLLSESKYGFGCLSGMLHMSLLRTVRYTESNHGGGDDFAAYGKQPEIFDIGRRTIRYAFGLTSASAPRHEQPAALAEKLYTTPLAVAAAETAAPFELVGCESAVPAWVRPAKGGGLLIRLHETLGRRGSLTVKCAPGFKAQLVQMDQSIALGEAAESLPVPVAPYKILSVQVRR